MFTDYTWAWDLHRLLAVLAASIVYASAAMATVAGVIGGRYRLDAVASAGRRGSCVIVSIYDRGRIFSASASRIVRAWICLSR